MMVIESDSDTEKGKARLDFCSGASPSASGDGAPWGPSSSSASSATGSACCRGARAGNEPGVSQCEQCFLSNMLPSCEALKEKPKKEKKDKKKKAKSSSSSRGPLVSTVRNSDSDSDAPKKKRRINNFSSLRNIEKERAEVRKNRNAGADAAKAMLKALSDNPYFAP
ncbi:unnamed protein product [Symbiodinium natans]|uniref:Uncharacterized protein n=1 Tax=Symbiodinium natans TaxID=878477 RepID=A0A812P5B3_9DINO|nr:unnamed protein product [Symbiodinium natans]